MIQIQAGARTIELTVPSDVTFVEHAVELLRTLLRYQGVRDPTTLLLVTRELLKNAVVHGNRNNQDLPVTARVSSSAGTRYRIEVEDGGRGFDTRLLAGEDSGAPRHGFQIIRTFGAELTANERGNRITAVLDAPL